MGPMSLLHFGFTQAGESTHSDGEMEKGEVNSGDSWNHESGPRAEISTKRSKKNNTQKKKEKKKEKEQQLQLQTNINKTRP